MGENVVFSIPASLDKQGLKAKIWGPIWTAGNTDVMFLFDNTGTIKVAVTQFFDKWANSTDFVIENLPKNDLEVLAVIRAANQMRRNGLFDHQWGKGLKIDAHVKICLRKLQQPEFTY